MLAILASAVLSQAPEFVVERTVRLACTPQIDGVVAPDEWEPLANFGGLTSYLQWEPGTLYLAGSLTAGQAAVWSLDLKGDGWLVGKDNVEVRLVPESGTWKVESRLLDATGRNGPEWKSGPVLPGGFAIAGTPEAFEVKLLGASMPIGFAPGESMGVRAEVQPAETPATPYLPRQTAIVTLGLDQSIGLPQGLEWKSEYKARSVAQGETIRIRLNYVKPEAIGLERIDLRTEGEAAFTAIGAAFPRADRRGRAFVDYETRAAEDARPGYRVLQGKVVGAAGVEFVTRTSYQVAPLLVFDTNLPRGLKAKGETQLIRGSVTLRSQSMNRLDGTFHLELPPEWSIAKGTDRKFTIYFPRGSSRIGLELIAPKDATGLIPIKYIAEIRGKRVEQVVPLYIEAQ